MGLRKLNRPHGRFLVGRVRQSQTCRTFRTISRRWAEGANFSLRVGVRCLRGAEIWVSLLSVDRAGNSHITKIRRILQYFNFAKIIYYCWFCKGEEMERGGPVGLASFLVWAVATGRDPTICGSYSDYQPGFWPRLLLSCRSPLGIG